MPIRRHPQTVRWRGAPALAATGLALVLVGCAGAAAPTPTPSSGETPAPIFVSDEQALEAATVAYEAYRAKSAEIASDGGVNGERIQPFVSETFLATVLDEYSALQSEGLRLVGTTSIDTISLASSSAHDRIATVSIYLCRDVSQARAVNSAGKDVTPVNRDDRVPLQAFLVSGMDDPADLVVDGVEQWTGSDFCS
jgi:hypothetical protein